ncbi:MFS transporter [Streptomyces sp. TR1341]|uniref:MFS transporter n=1 Tax=Streptomyces sp. TR1341 TaxID=2601266 RepID=UPI00138AF9D5|nr:MFS transporter [Streptomyces sp. TR1341]
MSALPPQLLGAAPAVRRTGAAAGWPTAWSVALVTVLTSMPVFLPGAVGALIDRETGWSTGRLGIVMAVFWAGSLFGAQASRRTAVPLSADRVVAVAVLGAGLGLGCDAVVRGVGLYAGSAFGGVAYGFSQPHTNFLLMRRCSQSIQGLAAGLKQAAVPVATLLCSLSVPLLARPLGWRPVFLIAAGLCLVGGVLLLLVSGRGGRRGSVATARRLRLGPQLAALAGAGLFGAMVGNSLGGFLIVSLSDDGVGLRTAGMVAAAASALNVLVRMGAGRATDRNWAGPRKLLAAMFTAGVVGTALLGCGLRPAVLPGALLASAGGWGWAGLLHYVAGRSYPGQENQATAVTQTGVSLGAMLGPLGFGWVYAGSPAGAWALMSGAGLCALAAVLAATRWRPHRSRP